VKPTILWLKHRKVDMHVKTIPIPWEVFCKVFCFMRKGRMYILSHLVVRATKVVLKNWLQNLRTHLNSPWHLAHLVLINERYILFNVAKGTLTHSVGVGQGMEHIKSTHGQCFPWNTRLVQRVKI
jgi:hypothetical protein